MPIASLFFFLTAPLIVRDQPLLPAWSPDRQVQATTTVPVAFVTPEGGNYSLLFNGQLAYPHRRKHSRFSGYDQWHTFLSDLVWSPDSQRVAFVEKVYSWAYLDPYNRDFEGSASNKHFYLTIVARDGTATRYLLESLPDQVNLQWQRPERLILNARIFDLQSSPPHAVP